ncbi:D-glucuronyl C5-epimerase family protein [Pseudomonas aeruginosa]
MNGIAKKIVFSLSLISPLHSIAEPSNVTGSCPSIGPAPRTPHASAYQYATSGKFSISKEGLALFDYGESYGGLGKWANPYFNSNYANALYRDWINTGCTDSDLKKRFLTVADWYVDSAEIRQGMAVWPYPFHNDHFDLDPGWISGIGQARIAGVLYRAYAVSKKAEYKLIADEAMETYHREIKEGGVVTYENGVTWIEEAPDHNGRSYKILNGHITGLTGIIDIYEITRNPEWKSLIEKSVAAVKRDISKFDDGFISLYSMDMPTDKRRMAERGGYNSLHVEQMLWLYEHFNDPTFLKWAMHFQSYEKNSDKYSASYSVNAKTNGPERAKALMGGSAWTANEFPATLTIEPEHPEIYKGIAFDSLDLERRPYDFTVRAKFKGKTASIVKIKNNEKLWGNIFFKSPVKADKIEIEIEKGHRIVALASVMPIKKEFGLSTVVNQCNYRPVPISGSREITYTFYDALDNNESTSMPVHCEGWIIIHSSGKKEIVIKANGYTGSKFKISQSNDLASWSDITVKVADTESSARINSKFTKVEFDRLTKEIKEITFR